MGLKSYTDFYKPSTSSLVRDHAATASAESPAFALSSVTSAQSCIIEFKVLHSGRGGELTSQGNPQD